MMIDCASCTMRDLACGDCVVTFLLGPAEGIGSEEQIALAVLADGGLVPPLRMQPSTAGNSRRRPIRAVGTDGAGRVVSA